MLYLKKSGEETGKEVLQDFVHVRVFIDTHEWYFANTMLEISHRYCLLNEKGDKEEFRDFIRRNQSASIHRKAAELLGKYINPSRSSG